MGTNTNPIILQERVKYVLVRIAAYQRIGLSHSEAHARVMAEMRDGTMPSGSTLAPEVAAAIGNALARRGILQADIGAMISEIQAELAGISDTRAALAPVVTGRKSKAAEPVSPVLRSLSVKGAGVTMTAPKPTSAPTADAKALREQLAKCAGRNRIEQAQSLIRSWPGGTSLSPEELHAQACELVRGLR
jgi:hypothetical protein